MNNFSNVQNFNSLIYDMKVRKINLKLRMTETTFFYDENIDTKNREFGKDITNSFIGVRKSIDKGLKSKHGAKVDVKNFQFGNNNKKTHTTNFSKFAAPRQSLQGIKKPLKKTSFNCQTTNLSNTINYEPNQNMMEIESSIVKTEINEEIKDSFICLNTFQVENEVVNIQEVPEYCQSIFLHLKETELNHPEFYPTCNYMKSQFDINEKMRAILFDWLVDVHLKFKLLPETLFLTFNIIDRYLNLKSIHRTKLQLVGVTSMLIACKYEEIYAPEVKDFIYITDKAYNTEEVKSMEVDILAALEFNVTMPSSFRFTEFFNFFIKYNPIVFNFTLYLLELSVVDYKMLKYKASLLASAVIYVSTKLLHKENIIFNDSIDLDLERLMELSGYTEEEIKECAKDVCLIYDSTDKSSLCAIKKKFSLPKFNEVSKIKFGK